MCFCCCCFSSSTKGESFGCFLIMDGGDGRAEGLQNAVILLIFIT